MITTDSLAVKLDRLRELDRARRCVFGADTHRYVSRRVPERELRRIEAMRGVLPSAFRDFLSRVGTGAGPYHGILRLKPEDSAVIPGHVTIARRGGGESTVLVTAGDLTGTVRDAGDDILRPARTPPGADYPSDPIDLGPAPTFEAWYDAWLTCAIEQLIANPVREKPRGERPPEPFGRTDPAGPRIPFGFSIPAD
ncbi:hypothetical protein [Amycolatopsis sp. NPDC051372]|uniref:hypothetical protein n=1 Tax=unclassified Amycolatopsis TaxID=2618356 RepID=UPI003445177B